ncbi:MAG: SH3 domain-containing protein [Sedimenticola sp.]
MKKTYRYLLPCAALLLAGCMTQPTYTDRSDDASPLSGVTNRVNYTINPLFTGTALSCVAIMPLELSPESRQVIEFPSPSAGNDDNLSVLAYPNRFEPDDKKELVRRFLQAQIAVTPPRLVPLKKVDRTLAALGDQAPEKTKSRQLGCRWFLEGTITRFSVVKMGIYSSLQVGAELRLVRAEDGFIAWRGSHLAGSHDGAVPLTPVDIMMGAFKAQQLINADEMESVASDLARRLVRTMPLDPDNMLVAASRTNHLFRVSASHLNLRTGPGTGYSVTRVLKGTERVALLGSTYRAPWYHVVTGDGIEGYVSRKYLEPL